MDAALLEQLLYEDESSTLDFKRDQYKFNGATDEERSELIKDILGFTNGWRRSDAYILIGVEEVRGGRSTVVGTADHLEDHTLQQFVNSKVNKPIQFGYEVCTVDKKQIGVIRIEQQPRPFYLKKDYGKLEKDKVYVRRGSSTDPTKPATPEEIVQMGVATNAPSPDAELKVEFAHAELDDVIGVQLPFNAEWCSMPDFEEIPRLVRRRVQNQLGIDISAIQGIGATELNPSFFKETANYEYVKRLYRPFRLVVTNTGKVAANDVRLEIVLPKGEGIGFLEPSEIPSRPKRERSRFDLAALEGMGNIHPIAAMRSPGYTEIDTNDDRFKLVVECGNIQPGRKIFSNDFCIGVAKSGEKKLAGQLYAENLSKPNDFDLTVDASIDQTSMTVDDLVEFANASHRKQEDD